VHASQKLVHPQFPKAHLQTPQLIALTEADSAIYNAECFGPVAYLVAVKDGAAALAVAQRTVQQHGALTLGVYSQNASYVDQAVQTSLRAKVALSINLTQGIFVNQTAAYSDYHATGGNPAANASYTTLAFVADRFVVVQQRQHV
ncbi:MAG: aldehyde dehydrogenase family protein, partial [Comamonas sp.]